MSLILDPDISTTNVLNLYQFIIQNEPSANAMCYDHWKSILYFPIPRFYTTLLDNYTQYTNKLYYYLSNSA